MDLYLRSLSTVQLLQRFGAHEYDFHYLSPFRWPGKLGKTVPSTLPLTSTGLASIMMTAMTAGALIDPGVNHAAVEQDVAGFQMDDLATV
ncbi:MAG: hypothetical protein WBZ36_04080 [Candidatus Nitrosopolaris sp.]